MALKDYIENTAVFTSDELFDAVGRTQANANLLSRAKRAGKVLSPLRGVYVSNTGRYRAREADPYAIAAKLGHDVVFAYDSALALHVGLHNVTTTTSFYANDRSLTVDFINRTYRRYPRPCGILVKQARRAGVNALVTTKEQTIVDCLRRPDRCGGIESLLRSLSVVRVVDGELLAELAMAAGPAVSSRCGWLLEHRQDEWKIPRALLDELHAAVGAGPFYFGAASRLPGAEWDNRWKLYLPASSAEMKGWLEG